MGARNNECDRILTWEYTTESDPEALLIDWLTLDGISEEDVM